MCAFEAVRTYLLAHDKDHPEQGGILSFRDPKVLLLAVGDGVTPRTAGLFAFRTSWRCVSIDPMMRSGPWDKITNLDTHCAKVQDVTVPVSSTKGQYERVVVVMWHCHVSIAEAVSCLEIDGVKWDAADVERSRELRKRIAVVSCACCNYDAVQRVLPDGSPPDEEYEDAGVPGLMRTVRVWKFVK